MAQPSQIPKEPTVVAGYLQVYGKREEHGGFLTPSTTSVVSSSLDDEFAKKPPGRRQSKRRTQFPSWLCWQQVRSPGVELEKGPNGDWSGSKSFPTLCGLFPQSPLKRMIALSAVIIAILLIIMISILAVLLLRGQKSTVVDVSYGKYMGVKQDNGVTKWLGMRYSRAPIGEYRFAAPAPPLNFTGTQTANRVVKGCQGMSYNPSSTNEDCLSIDVYAPSNATEKSNLPVFFFIQGGGLLGATDHPDCSDLIRASGFNIVAITITYRVGPYGFLASSEMQESASLNNGYKDQRYALQWAQQHISKFGGNPKSVTLAGQSAGAGSILGHLTAYGGKDESLYHAAILQSPSLGPVRTVEQAQYQFDNLTQRLGCSEAEDKIACLRDIPNDEFIRHIIKDPFPEGPGGPPIFPYNPVVDDDFVRQVPVAAFRDGNFLRVPTIFGDVNDEGTIFTPRRTGNASATTDFLANNWPTLNSTSLATYTHLYSLNATSSPKSKPYWYKAARAYGETRYVCPGMQLPTMMRNAGYDKVWNYRFNVLDPDNVANGKLVSHGVDIAAVFGASYGGFQPPSYSTFNKNIVKVMQGYWTSFVLTHDPNAKRAEGTPVWERWEEDDGEEEEEEDDEEERVERRLRLEADTTAMEEVDEEQLERCAFLGSISIALDQ